MGILYGRLNMGNKKSSLSYWNRNRGHPERSMKTIDLVRVSGTMEFFAEPHIVRGIVYVVSVVLATGLLISKFSFKCLV